MILKNNGLLSRDILTPQGKLCFRRTVLIPADPESARRLMEVTGVKSVIPLDIEFGIAPLPFKMTCEMMCNVAEEAVKASSYADARSRIEKIYHADLSVRTIERVTDYVGACVQAEYDIQAAEAKAKAGEKIDGRRRHKRKNDILYIQLDGAMIHIRDKDATSTDPGYSAWMESKHVIAFHQNGIITYTDKDGNPAHHIKEREFIGVIGSVDDLEYHFLALTKRKGADLCKELVFISDGAQWIHNLVMKYYPRATHIIDLYHVKENVGKFVMAMVNDKDKKEFADELCSLIEGGKIDEVLKLLEPYKDLPRPKDVSNVYAYIENHSYGMNYPLYKQKGYPLGSGAMESGNKQLMQNRMKLQGMRWKKKSAQHMLSLKAMRESGRWDDVRRIIYENVYGQDNWDAAW